MRPHRWRWYRRLSERWQPRWPWRPKWIWQADARRNWELFVQERGRANHQLHTITRLYERIAELEERIVELEEHPRP